MPMFGDNILPDVIGRTLGSVALPYDIYARNINFTGALNGGQGIQSWTIANPTAGVNSLSVSSDSGDGAGILARFIVTNPGSGAQPQFQFKKGSIVIGGVNTADSLNVPVSHYAGPVETGFMERYYRRGDNANPALDIDTLGEIISYVNGTTATGALLMMRLGEVNPFMSIAAADGAIGWGAGGGSALDVGMVRTSAGYVTLDNRAGGYGNFNLNFAHFFSPQGTAPFQVESTTQVAKLNASLLAGTDWTSPPTIGSIAAPNINAAALSVAAQLTSLVQTGTAPMVVSSTTPVANLTVNRAQDVTVLNTVFFDGSGLKHARTAIPSLAANANNIFRVTWNTAFPDAGYTVVATLFDSAIIGGVQTVPGLRVIRKTGQAASYVEFYIKNEDTTNAHSGVLHTIAMRG